MASISDSQLLKEISSELQLLTVEGAGFSPQSYARFSIVFEIEKKFTDRIEKIKCQKTIEKVEQLFNEYLDSIRGFRVNQRLEFHGPAIYESAKENCPIVLKSLVSKGAYIYSWSNGDFGDTPLKVAISRNAIRAVEMLFSLGVGVNNPFSSHGCTFPIHYAISPEMVRLLHAHGADVNARCSKHYHCSALHEAAFTYRPDMVKVLLALGANGFTQEGKSALDIAKDNTQYEDPLQKGTIEDARECVRLLLPV